MKAWVIDGYGGPERMTMRDMAEPTVAEIATLLDDGSIKPVLDRVFPFDDLPSGMARIESGHAVGKVVIER